MRVLRLSPGLGGRKGKGDGNPTVVPRGMVPVVQDGMGDAGRCLCWASILAHLQPGTASPENGCANVLARTWCGGRDAGLWGVRNGKRGCEGDPWSHRGTVRQPLRER